MQNPGIFSARWLAAAVTDARQRTFDVVADLDDEQLVETAVRELADVLGIKGPPSMASVAKWRRAGAQHNVGHLARVADIEARLESHRGLFVAGSGFRAVGIPDCIADGRAAALRAADCTKIR